MPGLVGSPPPTRGTRIPLFKAIVAQGITPAYAGNTRPNVKPKLCYKDHPRLRGEHLVPDILALSVTGSPPPTRGTHRLTSNFAPSSRITPAYAGNTCGRTFIATYKRDHPRLRGEHFLYVLPSSRYPGSPPPTRGTLLLLTLPYLPFRITPAYAGNTFFLKLF